MSKFNFALLLALVFVATISTVFISGTQIHPVREHLANFAKSKKPSSIAVSDINKKPTIQTRLSNGQHYFNTNLGEETRCTNGEYCGGNSSCCNGGEYCCAKTAQYNTTCCSPTCCQSSGINLEQCCPDPNKKYGGVCCISEDTKCCAPDPARQLPSRCCPQWSICCPGGKFGCCDPDTLLPIEETGAVQIAHALLLEPEWNGNMKFDALTIDASSGNYTQVKIGNTFDTFGETPRSFTYDNNRDVFYLPQANFTEPPVRGDDPEREVTLYTINGLTGATTKQILKGVTDLVTGYYFSSLNDVLVIATVYYTDTSKTTAGYKFYHVDPKTNIAKLVAEHRTIPGTALGAYDGWFTAASGDLTKLFRLGFEKVKSQVGFGIGVTTIPKDSTTPPPTQWINLASPPGHNNYQSLTIVPSSSPSVRAHFGDEEIKALRSVGNSDPIFFLSLAGSENATRFNDLDLFLWPLANPAMTKQIATFSNAHTTPEFGPIQEALNADGSQYTALVVCDSKISSELDSWCMVSATVDSKTSSVNVENTLNPFLLAETVSVAGLGIPASTKKIVKNNNRK